MSEKCSPTQSPKILSRRSDSHFNFSEEKMFRLKLENLNSNEINKIDISSRKSSLKPTPFQIRKEGFLKYKSSLDLKQRMSSATKENLFLNPNNIREKDELGFKISKSTYKNKISPFEKIKYSNSLKTHLNQHFSILFRNSPNKRKSSPIKSITSECLDFDISSFNNKSIETRVKFKLPIIKINSKNKTTSFNYINYEARRRDHFSKNLNLNTAMPFLYKY